ncbi:MAG: hypothetical protein MPJ25_13980 [Pirellulales bacterium]|nr:hypothetical protein [Pirellulales bacterium]
MDVDRIFPTKSVGFVKGELVNESGFSTLIVNFYSARRENQELILKPREAVEVDNFPCERLQIKVKDDQVGQYSYTLQLLDADDDLEVMRLLEYSSLKKNFHGSLKRTYYPEIGSFVPNSQIADIFRRRMLNLPNYHPLYEITEVAGGTSQIQYNTILAVSVPGAVGASAAASAFSGFHNSYYDPVILLDTITLEALIFDLGFELRAGYEIGMFWNVDGAAWTTIEPAVKKFGFYKKPNNSNWFFHIDDTVSQSEIDTGISLATAPAIGTRFILKATPSGSELISQLMIGTFEVAFENTRSFSLAPTEALFPNFYARNDSLEDAGRFGIGSYGWSAEAR